MKLTILFILFNHNRFFCIVSKGRFIQVNNKIAYGRKEWLCKDSCVGNRAFQFFTPLGKTS